MTKQTVQHEISVKTVYIRTLEMLVKSPFKVDRMYRDVNKQLLEAAKAERKLLEDIYQKTLAS